MVTRTRLSVTLYVHFLSCLYFILSARVKQLQMTEYLTNYCKFYSADIFDSLRSSVVTSTFNCHNKCDMLLIYASMVTVSLTVLAKT